MSKILVVDDEIGIRELLSEILKEEGHQVATAEDATQARESFSKNRPDLVLLDIWMPDVDGVTLLKEWSSTGLMTMPVIMMSGHGTIDTAVEATRIGAYSFLEKPIALQKLLSTVSSAIRDGSREKSPQEPIFVTLGRTEKAIKLKKDLDALKTTRAPALFVGEPGCGIDQIGALLRLGDEPIIVLDGKEGLESPKASQTKQIEKGITLIRDIDALPRNQQRKLVDDWPEYISGGKRILASTRKSLSVLVSEDKFELNLFEKISEYVVNVPPLRDRLEDIIEIARAMLSHKYPEKYFSVAALNKLRSYSWPANLSQLQASISTCAQSSTGDEIGVKDVIAAVDQSSRGADANALGFDFDRDYRSAKEMFDKQYLEYHLAKEQGNMSKVANKAGIERTHLYRKLKQLGIKASKKSDSD
jgi:two-component system nitrogen regulation response regulator NtrX